MPVRPIDAEDVKANFDRILDPKSAAFGYAWAYLSETNHSMNLSHCEPRMTFTRYEQLRALDHGANSRKRIVADYIFEKDKLFACLNLNDQELEVYNRFYNTFRAQLPTPDLVIYLQATPEVLKKRLRKKNSPSERAISDDYIEEVAKAYEHFFFHYTLSDLLVVNTSDIDFVDRNEDLQELLRRLSEPIHGTQYFLPLGSSAVASGQ